MKRSLWQCTKDYFLLESLEAKSEAIDRAISKDLKYSRVINKTIAEKVMVFLYLYTGKKTIKKIQDAVNKVKYDDTPDDHRKKIEAFLTAIIKTSPDVFELNLPPTKYFSAENFNEDIIKFYTDRGYDHDLKHIYQYKKLLIQVFHEMGYVAPVMEFILKGNKEFLFDKEEVVSKIFENIKLSDYSSGKNKVIAIYKIDKRLGVTPIETTHLAEIRKQNYTKNKNKLFYLLLIISTIIGITESFFPFEFAAKALNNLGISSAPAKLLLSVGVAFSAFSVSSLLFYSGSYASFKDIFLKNKSSFFYDEAGKKLRWFSILRNSLAVALSVFAAITITCSSYYFYSAYFPPILVIICVIANIVGWTGLLIKSIMSVFNFDTIQICIKSLNELFLEPLREIFQISNLIKATMAYLCILIINIVALLIMCFLSIGVISATWAMFFYLLSGVVDKSSLLAPILTKNMVKNITSAAEIALGAFFVSNLFRIIDFMRRKLTDLISLIYNLTPDTKLIINPLPTNYRKKEVRLRNILGSFLVICAVVNGMSSAAGYYNSTEVTETILWVATLFGIPATILSTLVSLSIFAVIACLFSSIGATIFPVLNMVSVGRILHRRKERYQKNKK